MQEVLAIAARVAATPSSSALLIGESGVGKEVVASYIHEKSERRKGAFVRVNLAAIPETMVEAELFGSVRGAFTDAKRDRAGHFASADGGTILLDEVCEFKHELQPKLLRALEERQFYPVGSDRERRMNVRVLAATNRDPLQMIERGLLREDLHYRLSTIVIRIPAATRAPRRHLAARRPLRHASARRARSPAGHARPLRRGLAPRLPLARQRARTAKRDRARHDHRPLGGDRRRRAGLAHRTPRRRRTPSHGRRRDRAAARGRRGSDTSCACSSAWVDRRHGPRRCSASRVRRSGKRPSGTESSDVLAAERARGD